MCLALLFLTSCRPPAACEISEWMAPDAIRVAQDWRNSQPDRFLLVRGEFDGDGLADEAELVVRDRTVGVVVCFGGSSRSPVIAYQAPVADGEIVVGIKPVRAGRYETACGKGYFDCGPGESPELVLTNTAIEFFKYESAESILYWDTAARSFKQVWLSD